MGLSCQNKLNNSDSDNANTETINRSFEAFWGDTWWKFKFNLDGSLIRSCYGHYDTGSVKGTYFVSGDSIIISSGFENTDRTINEFYLLSGECIIDLNQKKEYCINKTEK